MKNILQNKSAVLFYAASGLLCLFIGRIAYYLAVYGDTYPHWDEWDWVPINAPVLEYLFRYNNENLQIFTNLIYVVLEYAHLPFFLAAWGGFAAYLLMCLGLWKVLSPATERQRKFMLVLLFIPFFSDYMLDNLFWAATSSPWFYFMFMIWAVYFGFVKPQNTRNRCFCAVCIACSVLAMNIPFAILFTLVYLAKNIVNAKDEAERKKECWLAAIWLECAVVALGLFWYFMRQSEGTEIPLKALFTAQYYEHLSYALINPLFGFWLAPENAGGLLLLLLVFVAGLGFLFWRQYRTIARQGSWAVLFIAGGGMAALTLFRGEMVLAITDHSCRYLGYALFCLPAMYVIGCGDKNKYVRMGADVLALLMLGLTICGHFSGRHIETMARIERGRLCAERYYAMEPRPLEFYCSGRYPKNLAPHYDAFEEKFLK